MPDELTRRAAALAYRKGDYAPRVLAKGEGAAAEAIITLAKEAGVYVHQSPDLVAMLMKVDLDGFIPEELYIVIAELLAWIYKLEEGESSPGANSLIEPYTPS